MEETAVAYSVSNATAELELWKTFNLEQRKANLDKSCVEMREAKTASISGRKRLNDITKAFRAKPKEEQINMMTEILKCYQEEIDQLSRRSKFCETTFFALYKALYELPDPVVSIEGLITTVMTGSTNQLEIERLRSELNQYEEEFRQLKNQDITIRRLEDALSEFKEQNEDKILEEVERRMLDVEARADGRVAEVLEHQRTVEKRYAAAVESMKQAQISADRAQTQLYEVSSQAERKITALQSENSMLAEGMQRLSLRLAESEREAGNAQQALQDLQQQIETGELAIPKSSKASGAGLNSQSAEEELKTLQVVVSSLREDLVAAGDAGRAEKQRLEASCRELTQQLAREKEQAAKWRQELAERPSKEEFSATRKQLRMVTKIAFNVQDEDMDEAEVEEVDPETTHGQVGVAGRDFAKLEALLAGRMKSLESDLTVARRDLADARRQEASAKEQIAGLKKSVDSSTALIARLEADLEARSAALESYVAASTGNGGGSGMRSASSGALGGSRGGAGSSTPLDLAALLGVQSDDVHSADVKGVGKTPGAVPAGNKVNNNNPINTQMISILQSQRDQYKDKLTRTETLLQKVQLDLESAQLAKERLETDNLALYSKIKYLQSYGGSAGSGGAGGMSYKSPQALRISNRPAFFNPRTPDRKGDIYADEYREQDEENAGESEGDVVGRYHQLYEQRMNPFDQFSQREKQRKLQELTVADRIVLNTTMALVSNQTGRNFLLMYLGAMHLFMFCIIYYTAHHSHSGCDPSIDHLSPQDTAAIASGIANSVKF